MKIGCKISKLLRNHNISQNDLAEQTGVSQTKIHEIISGKTQKIDFLFIQKVCKIFNVDLEHFVEENLKFKIQEK